MNLDDLIRNLCDMPMAELREVLMIRKGLKALGLKDEEQQYIDRFRDGAVVLTMSRESQAGVLALQVAIQYYPQGYHVVVNAEPYDRTHHRSTPRPINAGEVVGQVETFLAEISNRV